MYSLDGMSYNVAILFRNSETEPERCRLVVPDGYRNVKWESGLGGSAVWYTGARCVVFNLAATHPSEIAPLLATSWYTVYGSTR